MLRVVLILVLWTGTAEAQSYLPEATKSAAQTRSQQECTNRGCDGVQTVYWWDVQPLTDGTATIVIAPSGDFGGSTLTAPEQASLTTANALGTKLPTRISQINFQARFTAAQLVAMNASTDPAIVTPWTTIKAAAVVDLTGAAVQAVLTAAVLDGIIPSAQAILQPVATP